MDGLLAWLFVSAAGLLLAAPVWIAKRRKANPTDKEHLLAFLGSIVVLFCVFIAVAWTDDTAERLLGGWKAVVCKGLVEAISGVGLFAFAMALRQPGRTTAGWVLVALVTILPAVGEEYEAISQVAHALTTSDATLHDERQAEIQSRNDRAVAGKILAPRALKFPAPRRREEVGPLHAAGDHPWVWALMTSSTSFLSMSFTPVQAARMRA